MNKNTKIIKIKKNNDGDITDVMLENGDKVPINHAILMVKKGMIQDVTVGRGKNGGEFLKNDPNGISSDNLNNYPTFN